MKASRSPDIMEKIPLLRRDRKTRCVGPTRWRINATRLKRIVRKQSAIIDLMTKTSAGVTQLTSTTMTKRTQTG